MIAVTSYGKMEWLRRFFVLQTTSSEHMESTAILTPWPIRARVGRLDHTPRADFRFAARHCYEEPVAGSM
jgi:hypothetical protein